MYKIILPYKVLYYKIISIQKRYNYRYKSLNLFVFKERLPALVRDLFTFSSKVIKSFIIV
jgi:hypothetical protein